MACIEGTVEYDTPSSVVLRLKKRTFADVVRGPSDSTTSLIPRPTGSGIKNCIETGDIRAHPSVAAMTASQISSRVHRIAERAEFRKILEAGQWCSRAQAILEKWLLKAPRQEDPPRGTDRPPAIEDVRSEPAPATVVVSSSSSSSDSSSSSSSSSDAAAEDATKNADEVEDAMPDSDDMAEEECRDVVPIQAALPPVESDFDVNLLSDDVIEQHQHWVNLNDEMGDLVEDNERLRSDMYDARRTIARLRNIVENQGRLISWLQSEAGFAQ